MPPLSTPLSRRGDILAELAPALLPVNWLNPNPDRPRRHMDEQELKALAKSIQEQGLLQPILVRPEPHPGGGYHYVIVAGERRWLAVCKLGWEHVPVVAFTGETGQAALVENLQRVDLSPLETARALRRLLDTKAMTQQEAARLLGRGEAEVSKLLSLLSFGPEEVALLEGSGAGVAKSLLMELVRLPAGPERQALLADAIEGKVTIPMVRAAKARLEAGEPPAPAMPAAARTGRLTLKSLDKLTTRFATLALPARNPEPVREKLRQLRDQLDRLLATG